QLQTLDPGAVWASNAPGVYASDLKALLNGARVVQDESSQTVSNRGSTQVVTPYDAQSTNVQDILTMISFYRFSGGAEYVGLSQNQLRHMEISDTIRLNHAVLIGHLDVAAGGLRLNDQQITPAGQQTLVRLFLPVDRRPAAAPAQTREDLERNPSLNSTDNN
ncbi:MAG: hypothetical protein RIK87_24110, partial [Fuerstiella sp.]